MKGKLIDPENGRSVVQGDFAIWPRWGTISTFSTREVVPLKPYSLKLGNGKRWRKLCQVIVTSSKYGIKMTNSEYTLAPL